MSAPAQPTRNEHHQRLRLYSALITLKRLDADEYERVMAKIRKAGK